MAFASELKERLTCEASQHTGDVNNNDKYFII